MLPLELTQRNQWICWRYEKKEGRDKPTKVPYNPVTGYPAKSTDAATWADYETALRNIKKYDGIGFVFSKNDPYVGIDLDHVLDEKGNFKFEDAKELFEKCNSYTEISPSGTGIHILIKAKLSEKAAHRVEENPVLEMCEKEMYESGRYFTVTGKQLGNVNTINDGQAIATEIEKKIADQQKFNKAEEITVHTANTEKDPLLLLAKKTFPEITESKKLVKKAAQIEAFLAETQITKIQNGATLNIEYTRNGCREIAMVQNDNGKIQLPQDPQNLKEFAYQNLIRHIEDTNLWETQKKPLVNDLGAILSFSIKEMQEKGIGANSRIQNTVYDGLNNNEETAKEKAQELRMDLIKHPILSKYIQEWRTGENGKKYGISVSGEILNAVRFSDERTMEKEQKQENVIASEQSQEKTQETERPKEKICGAFFSQDSDVADSECFGNREYTGNCLKWLQAHGINTRSYEKKDFPSNVIYTDCNFSHFPAMDENIENVIFQKCCFDHVGDTATLCCKDKNIKFDDCRFATEKDYSNLKNTGAEIKNCMFFDRDAKRWEVVNDRPLKQEKTQEKAQENKKVATRDL